MKDVKKAAVPAVRTPLVWIMRPYRGPRNARIRNSAENMVENTAKQMMVLDSQSPTLFLTRVLLRQVWVGSQSSYLDLTEIRPVSEWNDGGTMECRDEMDCLP